MTKLINFIDEPPSHKKSLATHCDRGEGAVDSVNIITTKRNSIQKNKDAE